MMCMQVPAAGREPPSALALQVSRSSCLPLVPSYMEKGTDSSVPMGVTCAATNPLRVTGSVPDMTLSIRTGIQKGSKRLLACVATGATGLIDHLPANPLDALTGPQQADAVRPVLLSHQPSTVREAGSPQVRASRASHGW